VQSDTDKNVQLPPSTRKIQELFMRPTKALAIASVVVLCAHPVAAQDLSCYRGYALESSVAAVVTLSGARESDVKSLHERPAQIQQLEWHPPYVLSGTVGADPVEDVIFSFYNGALYQLVVRYDRGRMEGLTDADIVTSVSSTYGISPVRLGSARAVVAADVAPASTVVARWEDQSALMTLTRASYPPQYQLTVTSKALNGPARAAIKQANRLDTKEAPQRELDQRKQQAADALRKGEKARVANKAAFRP
jgi:hypothetical protein